MSVAGKAQVCTDGTTDYKPLRSRARDINRTHIQDVPLTWGNWHKKVDWLNTTFIIFIPAIGLMSSYWVALHPYTAIFSAIYYFHTGLGITASTFRDFSRSTVDLTCRKAIIVSGPTIHSRPPYLCRSTWPQWALVLWKGPSDGG
jgi:stearoyl-CoA desaturase (delta-9 desaturase)